MEWIEAPVGAKASGKQLLPISYGYRASRRLYQVIYCSSKYARNYFVRLNRKSSSYLKVRLRYFSIVFLVFACIFTASLRQPVRSAG